MHARIHHAILLKYSTQSGLRTRRCALTTPCAATMPSMWLACFLLAIIAGSSAFDTGCVSDDASGLLTVRLQILASDSCGDIAQPLDAPLSGAPLPAAASEGLDIAWVAGPEADCRLSGANHVVGLILAPLPGVSCMRKVSKAPLSGSSWLRELEPKVGAASL